MKNIEWFEIVVPDPSFLSGKFVATILSLIKRVLSTKTIVLDGLSGANVLELNNHYLHKVVNIDSVLPLVVKAAQFDWCDFFLFEDDGFVPDENQVYEDVICKTTATVRAVDDECVYIYTQNEELVNKIKSKYSQVVVTKGKLDAFVYPE